jgi:hypothetical protein
MCAYPYEWFKAAYYDSRLSVFSFPLAFRPGLSASIPANYGSRKELGMTIRREASADHRYWRKTCCIKHIASVRYETGSNSSLFSVKAGSVPSCSCLPALASPVVNQLYETYRLPFKVPAIKSTISPLLCYPTGWCSFAAFFIESGCLFSLRVLYQCPFFSFQ